MRPKWSKEQARYREILREIRSYLSRNGMCAVIRTLRLAAPEYLAREAIRKTRDDARAIAESVEHLRELISQKTLAPELRLRLAPEIGHLSDTLQAVKEICQQAENQPRDDQIKMWCAKIAFSLMIRFSDKPPTSSSPRSPYRLIASLLYEVLSSESGHDLRRACGDELDRMRVLRQPTG
jgi:hypothetical protein